MDDNASWHTPGRSPIAGDYLGRDAVLAQFGRYGGDTDGTFKAELRQVFTSDDGRVIGLHHNSAQRSGKQLDTDCCIVFEVESARMISGRSTSSTSTTGTSSGRSSERARDLGYADGAAAAAGGGCRTKDEARLTAGFVW